MSHIGQHAYHDVKRLAALLKLVADPGRLRILLGLGLDCRPVSEIMRATGMSQTNTSFHLRALREAGLVRPERRGPLGYYCVADPWLLDILHEFAAWAEQRASAERAPRREAGRGEPSPPGT